MKKWIARKLFDWAVWLDWELLAVLDNLVTSIDENVSGDFSEDIDQSLWDDYGKALNVLRDYGIREPLHPIYRRTLK